MNDKFRCVTCGAGFEKDEAAQAAYCCPECGDELSGEKSSSPTQEHENVSGGGEATLRKNKVLTVVILILMTCLAGFFYWALKGREGADNVSDDKFVRDFLAGARNVNSKTPLMLDKSTRLDEVVVEGRNITYKNTLVNITNKDMSDKDLFKNGIEPFLTPRYCLDKKAGKALELGIQFGHEYYNANGVLLFNATINSKDCLESAK